MDPIFTQQFNMPAPKTPGGMFGGGKFDWKQAVLAAINGYLASRHNPVGMANLQMMQQAAQDKRENAEYDRRRRQALQDQISLYDYKAANPTADGEFETSLMQSGVQPGTPEWTKAMAQRRDNFLDPVVMTPQGPVLRSMITGALQPPAKPVGKLTPIDDGGAGLGGPRSFLGF